MLLPVSILLCSGFVQFATTEKIGSISTFNISSVPPRNIFLKNVHPLPKFPADHHSLKVVNGETAKPGQLCYQMFLLFKAGNSSWYCGGSLIDLSCILTAAHCTVGALEVIAVFGALDLSKNYEPGRLIMKVNSSSMHHHEGYDTRTYQNDIAIIKLPKPVERSGKICTVDIFNGSTNGTADQIRKKTDNNNNYTISGWGKTSDKTYTSKLMYATVSGEPQQSCVDYFKRVANYDVTDRQICTSGADGKSACNGDSGGPLVLTDESGNIFQRGIVSLGLRSCVLKAPTVYTDLCNFSEWLRLQL